MTSVGDVAKFLRQSDQAVAGYLRSGAAVGTKAGSEWLIPKKRLIEYLKP